MNEITSCTLDEEIKLFAVPININIGFKVYVELTFLDKNKNILGKKVPNNVVVEKNPDKEKYGNSEEIILYKFKVKDLSQELNINQKDIYFVNGWIDANDDKEVSIDYDEVSILEIVCECNEQKNYRYEVAKDTFVCFSKDKLDWLMKHEGYKENPYVPKDKFGNTIGDSGITLGYGYDLGHQTITSAQKDLNKYYSSNNVEKLLKVVGKTKQEAVNALNSVKSILISKNGAKEMLIDMLPIHAKRTYKIYPEMIKLCPYSQVALISLIYNRGNSLNGERRREMRNIQIHLKNGEYEKIYDEFINMKRIWEDDEGTKGLLSRREEEADLFMKGLNRNTNE